MLLMEVMGLNKLCGAQASVQLHKPYMLRNRMLYFRHQPAGLLTLE